MRNWQTTLLGVAAGILTLMSQGVNWKSALLSVVFGALGAASKDHDK